MTAEALLLGASSASLALLAAAQLVRRNESARIFVPKSANATQTRQLLDVFACHGNSPHGLVSLGPDATVWRAGNGAGVSCIESGKFLLCAGDPIATASTLADTAEEFAEQAILSHRRPVFLPSTEAFAQQMLARGWSCLKIGASPYFDLATWNPRGNIARHLRSSVNRAVRQGLSVEQATNIHLLRAELDSLCAGWLKTRPAGTSFGWLFALNPLSNASYKRFYVARDAEGRIAGLLAASPIPGRHGWYLEDVIRAPEAPSGVCDILVYQALRKLQAEGFHTATLGTVLFTHEGNDLTPPGHWERTQRNILVARGMLMGFYNFDGLHHFKAKFVPSRWESEYLVLPDPGNALMPLRITLAALRAIMPKSIWPFFRHLLARKPAVTTPRPALPGTARD